MNNPKPLTARECAERLMALERPTVVTHARPDGDAVGSATALYLVLLSLGKDARLHIADELPKRLEFLTEGICTKGELDGRELVSIDVAARVQLGTLSDRELTLMIDHHAKSTPIADYFTVSEASSAAEVLLEVTEAIPSFVMTEDIARRIYAAMSSDTGGFIYSNTSPITMRRAARLMEYGIDHADINHRLFHSKTVDEQRAEGLIAAKIKTAFGGRVAYATLSKAEREELGLKLLHFDTAVDIVRSTMGAEIAIFVRENDDGTYRASLRSTGADVAEVAAAFGGGGHIRAAGCSPIGRTVDEALEAILEKIIF